MAYEKPVVTLNNGEAEGVYMASGSDCYTAWAYITQRPETGRENYVVHAQAVHQAGDNHHSGEQILTLTFNQPVTFLWCSDANATLAGGDGTNEIEIRYNYHNNAYDNIGLGDIYVESGEGLADPSAVLSCNYDCGQH